MSKLKYQGLQTSHLQKPVPTRRVNEAKQAAYGAHIPWSTHPAKHSPREVCIREVCIREVCIP